MTWEEAKKIYGKPAHRQHHDDEEHRIQCGCIEWFRKEHRHYATLLFAIPNGGQRDAKTGKKLKDEGVLAGVADLFLAMPNMHYHGLWIEMKTPKGRQKDTQKEFERNVTSQGYQYKICRSLTEFITTITKYLKNE